MLFNNSPEVYPPRPANLTDTPGLSQPLHLDCNAHLVGLPPKYKAVFKLEVSRVLDGPEMEELIAQFNPYTPAWGNVSAIFSNLNVSLDERFITFLGKTVLSEL